MPARRRLIEMLGRADWRLVASGHVHQRRDFTFRNVRHIWAPSAGFFIPDSKQDVIGIKEVGLVEYRFQPDSFEVRHVRPPGMTDVDPEWMFKPCRTPAFRACGAHDRAASAGNTQFRLTKSIRNNWPSLATSALVMRELAMSNASLAANDPIIARYRNSTGSRE